MVLTTGGHTSSRPSSVSEQGRRRGGGRGLPRGPSVPCVSAGREPPPPALNKELFAGPGAAAPGRLLPPESAGSVLPLLAIHAESGGAQAGGGDPRSANGLARPPAAEAPGRSCSQDFGGSGLRPRGGEAGPRLAPGPLAHIPPIFPALRVAGRAPPAGAGPRLSGTRGAAPDQELRGLARTRRRVSSPARGGSRPPAHPTPSPKWLFAPPHRPPAPPGLGRRARALHQPGPGHPYGGSDRETGAGLGGRPLPAGAPDHTRSEAEGCGPAAPSQP